MAIKVHHANKLKNSSTLSLSANFMKAIPRAMWAIRFELRKNASNEFSVPQFRIMNHIYKKRALTIGELAKLHGLSLASMSRMVDVLVKRKLVIKQKNPKDKREVKLALTIDGEKKFNALKKSAEKSFDKIFKDLSDRDKEAFERTFEIFARIFTQDNSLESNSEERNHENF